MTRTGLALFGGAFDPPHRTHRRIARAAVAGLPVDGLRVLPSGDHPHKGGAVRTPAEHRLAMCRLNFDDLAGVVVDDRELRRPGPSYTLDTVRSVRAEVGDDTPLFWLIGSDNVPTLPQWHRHHELLAEVQVVTVPRAGAPLERHTLADLDLTDDERQGLLAHVLPLEPDRVSATAVRAALRADGDGVGEILPGVLAYIRAHGLYRD